MAGRQSTKKSYTPPPFSVTTLSSLSIKEYEASKIWRDKSKKILDDKDCKCAICGRHRWKKYKKKAGWKRMLRFSVHHVRYSNVPNEKPEDLLVLCWQCHDLCHLIFRLQHMAPFYSALAKIVRKFGFVYDKYMEGKE